MIRGVKSYLLFNNIWLPRRVGMDEDVFSLNKENHYVIYIHTDESRSRPGPGLIKTIDSNQVLPVSLLLDSSVYFLAYPYLSKERRKEGN